MHTPGKRQTEILERRAMLAQPVGERTDPLSQGLDFQIQRSFRQHKRRQKNEFSQRAPTRKEIAHIMSIGLRGLQNEAPKVRYRMTMLVLHSSW